MQVKVILDGAGRLVNPTDGSSDPNARVRRREKTSEEQARLSPTTLHHHQVVIHIASRPLHRWTAAARQRSGSAAGRWRTRARGSPSTSPSSS